MQTTLIRVELFMKKQTKYNFFLKHHYKITKYEAKVVSHGSLEYVQTGQSMAQETPVCPTKLYLYRNLAKYA